MTWLIFFCLGLCLPRSCCGAGGVDGTGASREPRAFGRRLDLKRAEVENVDALGLLPEVSLGGLRLRHVLMVHRRQPWRCRHVEVPLDYVARPTGRRLSQTLKALTSTRMLLRTPRDRVRTFAALNAAALPEAAYNVSIRHAAARSVYDDGKQVFAPAGNDSNSSNSSGSWNNSQDDMAVLNATRGELRQALGNSWTEDKFLGQHVSGCESSIRCYGDYGAALSVYEDPSTKILIFHGGWTTDDEDYLIWQHKIWILEEFEQNVKLQWTLTAQQAYLPEMLSRKGSEEDERLLRCGLEGTAYSPAPDITALAAGSDISSMQVSSRGLWDLVKLLVRQVLPSERSRDLKKIYLTGSGTGGAFAALTSMWLKKVEENTFDTYVIAGVGWQCLARRLYAEDMMPWGSHTQIHVYSHVFDTLSFGMDRFNGDVCHYGLSNFTAASDAYSYCSRIVGLTGPQLLYRGLPAPTQAAVIAGRLAFDACHYFTHSVMYAAMLFEDDAVLRLDGTTDGGCSTVAPVPQSDSLGKCPLTSSASYECQLVTDTTQPLPVEAMSIVAGSIAGLIFCIGLCGYIFVRRLQNDDWLDEKKKQNTHWGCFGLKIKKPWVRDKGIDRAAGARERALQKRQKEMQLLKKGAPGDETSTKKKKKPKKGDEAGENFLEGGDAGAEGGEATQVNPAVLGHVEAEAAEADGRRQPKADPDTDKIELLFDEGQGGPGSGAASSGVAERPAGFVDTLRRVSGNVASDPFDAEAAPGGTDQENQMPKKKRTLKTGKPDKRSKEPKTGSDETNASTTAILGLARE
mmetsp:Transcript_75998/g.154233  ORF Transcript_75998/g.154233 Transcript_75998/m.154233 type:complete len:800 (+) Transcript_75998:74-2473(+)